MLGSIALFGAAKGMVAMPNLSGMTRDAAISAIEAAGLKFISSTNVDSTSGNNGKVVSQSVSAGTLIDYESSITIGVGLYTAPSGPVITYEFPPIDLVVNDGAAFCVTTWDPYLESQKKKNIKRHYKLVDGVRDGTYYDEFISSADTVTVAYSANCGWVAPPAVTCGASYQVSLTGWSTCSGGYHSKDVKDCQDCTDGTSICSGSYRITEACCMTVSSTTDCSGVTCKCGFKACTKYTEVLCGSTTRTDPTPVSVSCTGGSLGGC